MAETGVDHTIEGKALLDCLMAPTKIYAKSVAELMESVPVHGLAHITGGGLIENLPRILKPTLGAKLSMGASNLPPLFAWLAKSGNIEAAEMFRVFNCGVGMAIVVDAGDVERALAILRGAGEEAWMIGEIVDKVPDSESVTLAQ